MVCDIYDVLDDAIRRGFINPRNISIAGYSNGGYITLCAAVKMNFDRHTHLFKRFRSAIAMAPVSDLTTMVSDVRDRKSELCVLPHIPNMTSHINTTEYIVDEIIPDEAQAILHKGSPSNFAQNLHCPFLLAHGQKDTSVFVHHSRLMSDRFQDAGKYHTYIELPDDDHPFNTGILAFWTIAESFLAQHAHSRHLSFEPPSPHHLDKCRMILKHGYLPQDIQQSIFELVQEKYQTHTSLYAYGFFKAQNSSSAQ